MGFGTDSTDDTLASRFPLPNTPRRPTPAKGKARPGKPPGKRKPKGKGK